MAIPTQLGLWAEDNLIVAAPETGSPTKVDPGSGYLAQGFVPNAAFIGPYANFYLHNLGLWAEYVADHLPDLTYDAPILRTKKVNPLDYSLGNWALGAGYMATCSTNISPLSGPINLPNGSTLISAVAHVTANTTGGGNMTLAVLSVRHYLGSDNDPTTIVTGAVDTSIVAAYDTLTADPTTPLVIDNTQYTYYWAITSGATVGSTLGTDKVHWVSLTFYDNGHNAG